MLQAATLQLASVRVEARSSTEYQPSVLWNDGTTTVETSEFVGNKQATEAIGAMTAYASASGGAVVNGLNGTLSFGGAAVALAAASILTSRTTRSIHQRSFAVTARRGVCRGRRL